jgi:hypothetical protein
MSAVDWLRSNEAHAAMYQKNNAICRKCNKSSFRFIDVPTLWPPAHFDPSNAHMLPDPKQDITKWKIVDVLEEIVYCLLLQN